MRFQSETISSFHVRFAWINPKGGHTKKREKKKSKATFSLTQQHTVVNFYSNSHPSGATKRRFISRLQMHCGVHYLGRRNSISRAWNKR